MTGPYQRQRPQWPERPPLEERPVPTLTHPGEFGPAREPIPRRYRHEGGSRRRAGLWAVSTLLAPVAAALLFAASVAQTTTHDVAVLALERTIDALAETDALLETHAEEIQAAGEGQGRDPSAQVAVPGFPVQGATMSAEDAVSGDRDRQRAAILRSAAILVYQQGTGVFEAEEAEAQALRVLSTAGGIDALMGSLSQSNQDRAQYLLLPLSAAAAALGLLVLLLGYGFTRFVALGFAAATAAFLVFLVALGLRLLGAILLGGEGELARETSAIARILAEAPMRNALWLGAAGLALALPALVLGRILGNSSRRSGARQRVVERLR